ncbi:MAG TPA: acyltransferase [Roseiarcus sp.]|nr:acyltransferase [Roseiarcus sp.]
MTAGRDQSGTIWSLQSLRFAAAMMVVYYHAAGASLIATHSYGFMPRDFQIAGRAGVDIFFVLSGVIIATTARRLNWREFAWRRVRRILPMYLLISIPAVLVMAKTSFGWRDAVATFFLWPATDRMTSPALTAAWTLCFEMVFYAAVTLVLLDRRLLTVCAGGFAAAMALRARAPIFQFLGNPIIFEFIFGVALSCLPRWRPAVWCLPIGAAALVGAGFIGIAPPIAEMELLAGDANFQRALVYGVPAAMIVFGAMQIDARPSAWTFLGDASYTLYLSHMLPIQLLLMWWVAHPAAPEVIIVAGALASVLFAWRIYVLLEIPLLRWLGRRNHAPSAAEPPGRGDRSTGLVRWSGPPGEGVGFVRPPEEEAGRSG